MHGGGIIGGSAVSIIWYFAGLTSVVHSFVPGTAVSFLLMVLVSLCTPRMEEEHLDVFFEPGGAVKNKIQAANCCRQQIINEAKIRERCNIVKKLGNWKFSRQGILSLGRKTAYEGRILTVNREEATKAINPLGKLKNIELHIVHPETV